MMRLSTSILALVLSSFMLSGCAVLAGAAIGGAAGGVAGTEMAEDDGRFDPLENTEPFDEAYE